MKTLDTQSLYPTVHAAHLQFNQFWQQKTAQNVHRAEFRDTSGTFSIACSAKFEIPRVKRRKTIKKMAENDATPTALCLFFILYSTLID